MPRKYKTCQSCAMPIKKDENKGTEVNGSLAIKHCNNCYKNGKFTNDFSEAKQMQEFVFNHMTTVMKFPKWMVKMFTKKIPKLERWAK